MLFRSSREEEVGNGCFSSICGFQGMLFAEIGVSLAIHKWLITGCGSAWLERLVWDQEVAGSNPVTPIYLIEYNLFARVAQWWSIALPRRGSRVRIPSRAFFIYSGNLDFTGFPLFLCV